MHCPGSTSQYINRSFKLTCSRKGYEKSWAIQTDTIQKPTSSARKHLITQNSSRPVGSEGGRQVKTKHEHGFGDKAEMNSFSAMFQGKHFWHLGPYTHTAGSWKKGHLGPRAAHHALHRHYRPQRPVLRGGRAELECRRSRPL